MPKLLADFLLEKQEPFALSVYLVERGYPKHNSAKYAAPDCSYFVRAVFSHLVVANGNGGPKTSLTGKSKREDGFSAATPTSCSECDSSHCSESAIRRFVKCGNCFLEGEVDDTDTNTKLRAEEEGGKQLSPVSVFGETYSDQDSPIHYMEQPSSSTSQRRLKQPVRRRNVFRESREVNQCDKHSINKMALQLLIDCKQELIELNRKREKNGNEIKAKLGAEEIWRHACEKLRTWSQDSSTESDIVRLLHSDFLASVDEWYDIFEQHKFEICMEIEKAIMENVVDEIITWLAWHQKCVQVTSL